MFDQKHEKQERQENKYIDFMKIEKSRIFECIVVVALELIKI